MSTELKQNAPATSLPTLPAGKRVAIISTEWNADITDALSSGACGLIDEAGIAYNRYKVPGAVELTYAASRLIDRYDAIIVLGCVIRGDTPHFDYVCQSVTDGVTRLNAMGKTPVIFGVLTVENHAQAALRAGGRLGNKGTEAAEAAIKMIDFTCNLDKNH